MISSATLILGVFLSVLNILLGYFLGSRSRRERDRDASRTLDAVSKLSDAVANVSDEFSSHTTHHEMQAMVKKLQRAHDTFVSTKKQFRTLDRASEDQPGGPELRRSETDFSQVARDDRGHGVHKDVNENQRNDVRKEDRRNNASDDLRQDRRDDVPEDRRLQREHIPLIPRETFIDAEIDLDGIEGEEIPRNKRYSYRRLALVAPIFQDELPALDEFQTVDCWDISADGISFLFPERPECEQFVICIGHGINAKYVVVTVKHTRLFAYEKGTAHRVGCQFATRVDNHYQQAV
ncbi:hypothetical protein [Lignipirellula cremea]|uniref:PilZ domain-containing protein n=1 Tax=Lignipirellula cremea TaxID=2528010 RepID=A0A518DVZ8_9BACT|nr:hypothetical protein [Lignipirellula cremea]QDU96011.1 hypothetical protein Pla8534_38300 [Lignipirellula cremea]